MIIKTYPYVMRRQEQGVRVLVFRHRDFPEAGVQVPGGTVEAGETLEAAILREVFEESGLRGLRIVRYLGALEYYAAERAQWQLRHFFELEAPQGCAQTWTHTEEDEALVFLYQWWPPERAEAELAGHLGTAIRLLAG